MEQTLLPMISQLMRYFDEEHLSNHPCFEHRVRHTPGLQSWYLVLQATALSSSLPSSRLWLAAFEILKTE
jgi:hypothetical protein